MIYRQIGCLTSDGSSLVVGVVTPGVTQDNNNDREIHGAPFIFDDPEKIRMFATKVILLLARESPPQSNYDHSPESSFEFHDPRLR
jgi:hypothetical protein